MNFLTNKKILLFSLVLIVIIGLVFTIANLGKKESEQESHKIQQKNTMVSKDAGMDLDFDGLKNWEEVLWGTDKNNPDTDGDGTLDGQELLEKRDPLIAGPNDKIAQNSQKNINQNHSKINKTTLTRTEILSQNLIEAYSTLKKNNDLGTIAQKNLISSITSKALDKQSVKKYTIHDIIITEKTDRDTLQNYADEMATVFKQDTSLENSAIILTNALQNKNEKELEKIDPLILFYEEKIQQMLSIKTPREISETHLALINNFADLIEANRQMQAVFSDPLLGLNGLTSYVDLRESSISNATDLGRFFLKNKLNYK